MAETVFVSTRSFPLSQEQKDYLNACAAAGDRKLELVWRSPDETTEADFENTVAVINFFPPAMLSKAPRLEWVQLASAGADLFTAPGILPENCVLTNGSGAYSLSVGEHMIAQTFALIRNLEEYAVDQRNHVWGKPKSLISVEGASVLVLGAGDIGRFYARKMNALGARVTGVTRHPHEAPEYMEKLVTMDEIKEVLPEADIIAMVLPGGKATEHIMNDEMFSCVKDGAYILNVGRGNAIDPAALRRALDSGKIRAAALDVTEPEPLPADDPLWDYPNVLLTPHTAGWWQLQETLSRVVKICGENLKAFSQGRPLNNVVRRHLGY